MASFSLVKYNRFAVKKSATSLTVLFNASSTEDPSAPCSPPDQSSRGNRAEAITLANACKVHRLADYVNGTDQNRDFRTRTGFIMLLGGHNRSLHKPSEPFFLLSSGIPFTHSLRFMSHYATFKKRKCRTTTAPRAQSLTWRRMAV